MDLFRQERRQAKLLADRQLGGFDPGVDRLDGCLQGADVTLFIPITRLQRLFRRARRAVGVPLEDTKLKSLQIAFFIPGQRPNHGFRPVRFQIFD